MKKQINSEIAIRELVRSNIKTFAQTFSERHISQIDNPNGTLNMKIHNVFISALGEEIQYFSALVRSFDSSLGNMLESLAGSIARFSYIVTDEVVGPLYPKQTTQIAELLEAYKNNANPKKVAVEDYKLIREIKKPETQTPKTHVSDYYLYDEENNEYFLIELKIGGDLDNKKARSEKESIFEQYAILSNSLPPGSKIKCYFATAYNRFGEGNAWKQGRVKQFFSEEELLIGKDFWNFICKSDNGFNIVMDEYKENAYIIKNALDAIRNEYLQ